MDNRTPLHPLAAPQPQLALYADDQDRRHSQQSFLGEDRRKPHARPLSARAPLHMGSVGPCRGEPPAND